MRFLLLLPWLLATVPGLSATRAPSYEINPLDICRLSLIAQQEGGGIQDGLLPKLVPYWKGQKDTRLRETAVSFSPGGGITHTLLRHSLAQYVVDQANYYVGPSPSVSKPAHQYFVLTPNSLVVDGEKLLTMPGLNPHIQSADLWNYGILLFKRNFELIKGKASIQLMKHAPAWAKLVSSYSQLFAQSLLMVYHNLPGAPSKYSKYHLLSPIRLQALQVQLSKDIRDPSLSLPESLDYSRYIDPEKWKETVPDLVFSPALSYVGSLIQFGTGGKPQRRKIMFAVFRASMLMLSERYKAQNFVLDPSEENQEVIDLIRTFLESE